MWIEKRRNRESCSIDFAGAHPWKAEEQGMSSPSFSISRLKQKNFLKSLKAKPEAAYDAPRFWISGSFFCVVIGVLVC